MIHFCMSVGTQIHKKKSSPLVIQITSIHLEESRLYKVSLIIIERVKTNKTEEFQSVDLSPKLKLLRYSSTIYFDFRFVFSKYTVSLF